MEIEVIYLVVLKNSDIREAVLRELGLTGEEKDGFLGKIMAGAEAYRRRVARHAADDILAFFSELVSDVAENHDEKEVMIKNLVEGLVDLSKAQ